MLQQIWKMFQLMENYKWKKIYSINVVNIFPVNCHVWSLCSTNMNMNSGTRTCIITTQSFYLTDFMLNHSFLQWLESYTLITCVGNRTVAYGLSSSHTWLFLLVNIALYMLVYVEDKLKGGTVRDFLTDMQHTTQSSHVPSSNCGKLGLWM